MYNTIDNLDVVGKRVLVRVDFNVPMQDGHVSDATRIERALPTIEELHKRKAKVILLSHFGRPKGEVKPEFSLAPVAKAFAAMRPDWTIRFVNDCIGDHVKEAVENMQDGDILVLENTRFYKGETTNDPDFAKALAANGDFYVNDAFSVSHRAHASTEGVAHLLPAAAGRAMQRELDYLTQALAAPERPVMAVVGGAKVSTKLDVLINLTDKTDFIVVGGGMANTFLLAMGMDVGKSLAEPDLVPTAKDIMAKASAAGCDVILPKDVVVATQFAAGVDTQVKAANAVLADEMVLDLGPDSVNEIAEKMAQCKTLIWNGPLGAFETKPFDVATIEAARYAARMVKQNGLIAVAGGGDTVAALNMAGVADDFTYISTAGGAFLEWMEGKKLPGVEVLKK
ncbi:MAG: phosphoglycerate kinase [bacterium]